MRAFLLGLALACAAGAVAGREDEGGKDQAFVTKASAAGLAEVNAGMLAAKNGHDAMVRKFGQHMVDDHTKANKELIDLASKLKLKVAEKEDAKHAKLGEKLAGLSGADFDRDYAASQVKDHEEAVSLFEKQSKGGSDAELKEWAGKTLPTLRHHLKMAKELKEKVGGSKRSEK
jgi:putative membrane protein